MRTLERSIARYDQCLELMQKQGMTLSAAYRKLEVDRNTIVQQAPIAELHHIDTVQYEILRESAGDNCVLKEFAKLCANVLSSKSSYRKTIEEKKKRLELIPISKKKEPGI